VDGFPHARGALILFLRGHSGLGRYASEGAAFSEIWELLFGEAMERVLSYRFNPGVKHK
jgi:hypothetical protein